MNAASYSTQKKKPADVEDSRHLYIAVELPEVNNSLSMWGAFLSPVERNIKPALQSFRQGHRMMKQVESFHNTR